MVKVAFLFPGQGSQYLKMTSKIQDQNLVDEYFKKAKDTLGFNLRGVIEGEDEFLLTQTENTQPALLTVSKIWADVLKSKGIKPNIVAGHSLGEFTALLEAEVFLYEEAVYLVRRRGELMKEAALITPGTMAAVLGLDKESLDEILKEASKSGIVEAVNFNSLDQIVISGSNEGIDKALELIKIKGKGRAQKLKVSAPFHSSIMKEAADKFMRELDKIKFNPPKIPVVNNVHAKIEMDPQKIKENLYHQLKSPVLWLDTIFLMKEKGIEEFYETGPKNVLTALGKKIYPEAKFISSEELYV